MYRAVIAKIAVSPHPNADRLQLGRVAGHQVIVGLDTQDGDVGIYFPSDGQLSEEFANHNDLVGYKDPETGERKGGYFDKNRRVRAQNFRGQKSDGFFAPLTYLFNLVSEDAINKLQVGDEFETIDDIPICQKYYTPKTLQAMANRNKQQRKAFPSFPKHVDTKHFLKEIDDILDGSVLYFTFKLHGTSQRFGYIYTEEDTNRKWWQFWKSKKRSGYTFENGTRNVVLSSRTPDQQYYECEQFRWDIVDEVTSPDRIGKEKLVEGEVIYGEVVGFTNTGSPIMPSVNTKQLKNKEFTEQYGETMCYSYGCSPDSPVNPKNRFYVYRIARVSSDGHLVEYSWPQVLERCMELGLNVVPMAAETPVVYFAENRDKIKEWVEAQLEGPSVVDHRHIREGLIIRVEPPFEKPYWLKAKSHTFKILEGIIKNDDEYVDMEEIS